MNRSFLLILWLLLSQGSGGILYAQSQDFNGWRFESQRPEIAPQHWVDQQHNLKDSPTLALAGAGKAYANGCWLKRVDVKANTFYEFLSQFQCNDVDQLSRSILARLIWFDDQGRQLGQAEYPQTLKDPSAEGVRVIRQIYSSPPTAHSAQCELVYRWDDDGQVYFSPAVLQQVPPVGERLVRVATVHYRPQQGQTSESNLVHLAELIARAAQDQADMICLPEGITLVATGKSYGEASEAIPGPTTDFLGKIAAQHRLHIVAGLYEKENEVIYNTAVLLDDRGAVAGKYRKVCLPREEYDGGITPGNSLPVFNTRFGCIGIMICWDVSFPTVAQKLAQQGAEIIFLPIWGGMPTLVRARAIENQVYIVTSSYDIESGVFDWEGNLLVQATTENQIAVITLDLNQKKEWPWLGDFKNRIPREQPSQQALGGAEDH